MILCKGITPSAAPWAGTQHPARPILGLFDINPDFRGLALARVSPRVSCLGKKHNCERQLTDDSAHLAASLAWKLETRKIKLLQKDDLGVKRQKDQQNTFTKLLQSRAQEDSGGSEQQLP